MSSDLNHGSTRSNHPSPGSDPVEPGGLLLAAARGLHENGQETGETLLEISRLGRALNSATALFPTWGTLFLQEGYGRGASLRVVAAVPSNVSMNRVTTTMRIIEAIREGSLRGHEAKAALAIAERQPPSGLFLFVSACAVGAVALALIFGATHGPALGLIALSGVFGALLRRALAKVSSSSFLQIFAAALLAGFIGALAVRWQVSSALRLVAVCPCMILVPGPHILNGALDLGAQRVSLGLARLTFAVLTVLMICAGLLIGLTLGGQSLPPLAPGRAVPLWLDTVAAGAAAAAYGVFFSMPLRMLVWPVVVGMAAHAARWEAMTNLGLDAVSGTGVACLVVGTVLIPVARRLRVPFAAVGFASVVSLMPGVYLFRMSSGFVQIQQAAGSATLLLLSATLSDAMTALLVVIVMTCGLALPGCVSSYLRRRGT